MEQEIERHLYVFQAISGHGLGITSVSEAQHERMYIGMDGVSFKDSINLLIKAGYFKMVDRVFDLFGEDVLECTEKGMELSNILNQPNEHDAAVFDIIGKVHQGFEGETDRGPMKKFFLENLKKVPEVMLRRFERDIKEAKHMLHSQYL